MITERDSKALYIYNYIKAMELRLLEIDTKIKCIQAKRRSIINTIAMEMNNDSSTSNNIR